VSDTKEDNKQINKHPMLNPMTKHDMFIPELFGWSKHADYLLEK